jgi:transcriptional regulator with XRE-family HTH domain
VSLGELIRKKRLESKLTQEQIAGKVGVSRVQYLRYENDAAKPRGGVLIKLQTELNIQTSDFADGSDVDDAQMVIPFDKAIGFEIRVERKQADSVAISIRRKRVS